MSNRTIYIDGEFLNDREISSFCDLPELNSNMIVDYMIKNKLPSNIFKELSYEFEGEIYSYGYSELQTTIMNLLGEYEKLKSGLSHDIEIDGYPIARCNIKEDKFFITDLDGEIAELKKRCIKFFSIECIANCHKLINAYRFK